MAGVQAHAEERVAEVALDDALQLAADLTDVQRAVPLGDRHEVRRDEAVDVVPPVLVELVRVLHDEAGAAVERSPDAEGDRERITPLDRAVARAEQARARRADRR